MKNEIDLRRTQSTMGWCQVRQDPRSTLVQRSSLFVSMKSTIDQRQLDSEGLTR
jgi:hypothetical protein